MVINYNDRHFRAVVNDESGEVSAQTTFHYRQEGDILWATYRGGEIGLGTMTGTVTADGSLDFAYQHVNIRGEIMTGRCQSTPEVLSNGRIRLHESWQWTVGNCEKGTSIVEEI